MGIYDIISMFKTIFEVSCWTSDDTMAFLLLMLLWLMNGNVLFDHSDS